MVVRLQSIEMKQHNPKNNSLVCHHFILVTVKLHKIEIATSILLLTKEEILEIAITFFLNNYLD